MSIKYRLTLRYICNNLKHIVEVFVTNNTISPSQKTVTLIMKRLVLTTVCLISTALISLNAQVLMGVKIDGHVSGGDGARGMALSANGKRIVISSKYTPITGEYSGLARVFEWDGDSWKQLGQTLKGQAGDYLGYCSDISADGNIIAIGVGGHGAWGDSRGWVSVYQYTGNQWQQLGDSIDGQGISGIHARAVSLSADGHTIAIGSILQGPDQGRVRVFKFLNGVWNQMGGSFVGQIYSDNTGRNVSLSSDGNRVVFGINGDSGNNYRGYVQVWEYVNSSWQQLGNNILGEAEFDSFGWSVELSGNGNRMVASAIGNDGGGNRSGQARVFEYLSGEWVQLGQDIDGMAANEHCGSSVSLSFDGNILAVGASRSFQNGISHGGSTRVFQLEDDKWSPIIPNIYGNVTSQELGDIVSLSAAGDRIAIASPGHPTLTKIMPRFTQVFQLPVATNTQTAAAISFSVSPNPNNGFFRLQGIDSGTVELYNSMGLLLRTWVDPKNELDISQLPAGMYYLALTTKNGNAIKRLVKSNPSAD
ncbi:MAG: T9SS type A sorting domain-containing protein [Saprospiraceae bacterium]